MPGLNRRDLLKFGGSTAAGTALPGWLTSYPVSRRSPNIILMISDDHPAQALGAYGGQLATLNPTPTLDRLAGEGSLFADVRARACADHPPDDCLSLASTMRAAGYHTAMIGKWERSVEPAAFDFYQVFARDSATFDPTLQVRGALPWGQNTIRRCGHASDCITDLALGWLAARDDPRPLFLVLHDKPMHDLFGYAPRYERYLADTRVPEPADLDLFARADRAYAQQTWQACLKALLRCARGIDDNLARLRLYLEAAALWEDTMIVYTSQPGGGLAGGDLIAARWFEKASLHLPLIVREPGRCTARVNHDKIADNTEFATSLIASASRTGWHT